MARLPISFAKKLKQTEAVYQPGSSLAPTMRKTLFTLVTLLTLHVIGLLLLEDFTLWQAIWLTFTTLSTVGYGDLSPQTPQGQLLTIMLLYLGGIIMMTVLVRDYIDYRMARTERIKMGFWDWNMAGHILIINSPKYNKESYFTRLITQIRENRDYADTPIQLLNIDFPNGLPERLLELGVVHCHGTPSNSEDLNRVHAVDAKHIVVLSRNEYSSDSDSFTFDIAYRLNELHIAHRAIIECVQDENRPRMEELGIKTILRPIRSYPEIIVRAMDAPGSEVLIEDMFTRANDHPRRYSLWLEGERWADVVNALMQANLGTALGYITKDGDVVVHPNGNDHVIAQSILVFVKTDCEPSSKEIKEAVAAYFKTIPVPNTKKELEATRIE